MEPVAVKEIDLTASVDTASLYKTEVKALRRLPGHKNLPTLVGNCKSSTTAQIVMSFYPYPTLQSLLDSRGGISQNEALYILRQLVETVHVLMKAGVAHRDIKTDNILINPATLQIKLIDFGLATIDPELDELMVDNQYIGTPYYMAPDVLKEIGVYSIISSELWSAGVVFWEMLIGQNPFKHIPNKTELLAYQKKGFDFSRFDAKVQVLLKGLLEYREERRSNLNAVMRYVKEIAKAPKSVYNSPWATRSKSISADPSTSQRRNATDRSDSSEGSSLSMSTSSSASSPSSSKHKSN